jgi:hypothetical protein
MSGDVCGAIFVRLDPKQGVITECEPFLDGSHTAAHNECIRYYAEDSWPVPVDLRIYRSLANLGGQNLTGEARNEHAENS